MAEKILPNFELNDFVSFNTNIFVESNNTPKEVVGFFIALASGYNDMKDLFWFHTFLQDNEPSNTNTISAYNGQYAGMLNYIYRHLISTCYEFTVLLKENAALLNHENIVNAESRLSQEPLRCWNSLKKYSVHKIESQSPDKKMLETMQRIRDGVGFHYYGIKNYFNGFQEYRKKLSTSAMIYASFGDDMSASRFYFADAATQAEVDRIMSEKNVQLSDLMHFMRQVNIAVRFIVQSFVESQNALINGDRKTRRGLKKIRNL